MSTLPTAGRRLPFDLAEVATNLREERYRQNGYNFLQKSTAGAEPRSVSTISCGRCMGVGVRKHLQKVRLSGWEKIPFPRWPVDSRSTRLMESAMTLLAEGDGADSSIPFIWFWPDGAPACAMMTHDVEGQAGPRLLRRADGPRRLLRHQVRVSADSRGP